VRLFSVHTSPDPAAALRDSDGIFVGGGNTFRLLDRMTALSLIGPIRTLAQSGVPYMGTSAGSNVACPTIMTTNDMPIVELPSFRALALVDFQINAHYVDRDPDVAHGGETRQQRIREFHEENTTPVIGLREGSWLSINEGEITLCGPNSARLFRPGEEPSELQPGSIGTLSQT
jgi:dipeptidase E